MKRFVLAGVGMLAMLGAGATANAADLSRRAAMPVKAPLYAPYNWTGLYVGINGGGAWGRSDWTSAAGTTGNFNVNGGLVGGTLGYNWQTPNNLVFGLETDIDWTDIKGSTACAAGTCETRNNYLGTARGRIGYAFNRVMPYITGGLAYGDVRPGLVGGSQDNDFKAGWTVGGGVEVAVAGPWSVKAEYLYADLGSTSCGVANCGPVATNVKFNTSIARAGINYRF
jgi:outer membrane immunogenic protein